MKIYVFKEDKALERLGSDEDRVHEACHRVMPEASRGSRSGRTARALPDPEPSRRPVSRGKPGKRMGLRENLRNTGPIKIARARRVGMCD